MKILSDEEYKQYEHYKAYYNLIYILIEGLKRLKGGNLILHEWDRARGSL